MRTPLLLALALAATLPACVCGGFSGGGDTVYRRGTESMVLCENGGFSATLATGPLEGRYSSDARTATTVATVGDSGALAFELTAYSDGTATAPQLGSLAWERAQLDQVDLDHANVQCTDLESRPWWTAQ